MVSQTVLIVGFVVIIFVVLVLALLVISKMTGENIANKSCKELAGHFDPTILTIIGVRPSHFLCDILTPKL